MRRADTSICGMTRWYWIRSNKREREIEMSHIERVKEVRAIVEPHYNCGQSILVPFCKELGMTEEQAYALGPTLGRECATAAPAGPYPAPCWCWVPWDLARRRPQRLSNNFRSAAGTPPAVC